MIIKNRIIKAAQVERRAIEKSKKKQKTLSCCTTKKKKVNCYVIIHDIYETCTYLYINIYKSCYFFSSSESSSFFIRF